MKKMVCGAIAALLAQTALATDWRPLVGPYTYDPLSLRATQPVTTTAQNETITVWVRTAWQKPEGLARLKVEGQCSTHSFFIVRVVTEPRKGDPSDTPARIPMGTRPGETYYEVVNAICTKLRPWWRRY